jgi:LysM repeat protein
MVKPVPGHLGEDSRFSPWLVVAAAAAVVLVGLVLLFVTQTPGAAPVSSAPEITATSRPPVTRVITATPANTLTSTTAPTRVVIRYTVKKNDTLSTIARDYKVSIDALRAANGLKDDTIRIGDILIIPQGTPTPGALAQPAPTEEVVSSSGPPTATSVVFRTPTLIAYATSTGPAVPTTPTPTPGVVSYIVRSGDTLLTIAAVYSTTVRAIMELNKLDGFNIRAGETLTVPVGVWSNTATPTIQYAPTITPTPEFVYGAPELLFPSEGADFAHDTPVTLEWLSPGVLKSDEYYVIHLRYTIGGVEHNLPGYVVTEGTYLTLDASPTTGGGPAQFSWYVVVVRTGGCGQDNAESGQPCAASPISETRTFTWR